MHKIISFLLLSYLPFILFGQHEPANSVKDSSASQWSFSASGYYYFIPGDKNSVTLIGSADHKNLHFEARYNYEDLNTASVFSGWRFETGKKLQFGATPILGVAFGNTNGLVPGIELDLTYKIFDFYSESEYLVDFESKENNFFYTWTELAVTPVHFLRTGITAQKTRLYQTDLEVQRGIFAQYSFWKLTAGIYYFNPFSHNNFVIASVSAEF